MNLSQEGKFDEYKLAGFLNEVSKQKDLDSICSKALEHLLGTPFDFHFCTIALIDKMTKKVKIHFGKSKYEEDLKTEIWHEINYSLKDKNILTFVLDNEYIVINGQEIYKYIKGKGEKVSNDDSVMEDFLRPNGIYANNPVLISCLRVFLPIRVIEDDNSYHNLGIIQCGVIKYKLPKISNDDLLAYIPSLKLYTINLGLKLLSTNTDLETNNIKFIINELQIKINSKVCTISDIYNLILKTCIEFTSAEDGNISLYVYDKLNYETFENSHTYAFTQSIYKLISNRSLEGEGVFSDYKQDATISEKKYKSAISLFLEYESIRFGFIELFSSESQIFDDYNVVYLQKLIEKLSPLWQRVKFEYYLTKLVVPFDIFPATENDNPPYLEDVMNYFNTSYVSIWTRNNKDTLTFKRTFATKEFKKICSSTSEIILDRNSNNEIQLVSVLNSNFHIDKFVIFSEKNNFKSFIYIPLIVNNKLIGIINIYSKRPIVNLNSYENNFLKYFRDKCSIFFQNYTVLSSIVDIFSFKEKTNIKFIFKEITERALNALNADVVFCYIVDDKSQTVKYKNCLYSGNLYEKRLADFHKQNEEKTVIFVQNILQTKEIFWLRTEKEILDLYKKYLRIRETKLFKSPFWEREEVKSLAIVPFLDEKGNPNSIMFINYRAEQNFSNDQVNVIKAFSNLMGIAVTKQKYLDLLEERFIEILPRATRTSFYQILEAVNHEIKDLLFRLKHSISQIKANYDKLPKKERQNVDDRLIEVEKAYKVINNLLTLFDFREDAKAKPTDINRMIKEIINFFEFGAKEKIIYDISNLTEIEFINCFDYEMSMIIYNLVSNAIAAIRQKYTQDETDDLSDLILGVIKFSTKQDSKYFYISIEDDGVGIPKNLVDSIFEHGTSYKNPKGTGIGLYFIRETIQNYYFGFVECNSRYSSGTTFTLKIPIYINSYDLNNEK